MRHADKYIELVLAVVGALFLASLAVTAAWVAVREHARRRA